MRTVSEGFPEILSRLRRERQLSQRTAASALHISQALLSHYENGLREPGLAFVDTACRYYHVSADYLLGRSAVRTGFADAELPAPLRSMTDSAIEALSALTEGLRSAPGSAEDVKSALSVFLFRLMQPFDGLSADTGDTQALSAAAEALLRLRLRLDGEAEQLHFTIPEALRREAERELSEVQASQR